MICSNPKHQLATCDIPNETVNMVRNAQARVEVTLATMQPTSNHNTKVQPSLALLVDNMATINGGGGVDPFQTAIILTEWKNLSGITMQGATLQELIDKKQVVCVQVYLQSQPIVDDVIKFDEIQYRKLYFG
jgi:hypothetical protein